MLPTIIKGGDWPFRYPEKVEISFGAAFISGTGDIKREIEDKIMSVAATDPWMKEHPPKIEVGRWVYGTEIDEDEPIVTHTIQAAREVGIEPKIIGWGTLSDAIHLVNYSKIPTISIGLDDKTIHMVDESADIKQLLNTTKVLALAILRWCGHA